MVTDSDESDDFRPTASWNAIRSRARLLKKIRNYFEQRGFIEVETPILSADTVIDQHLDPICVTDTNVDCVVQSKSLSPMWLQTSPEFHMKRLMASGGEAIYQISRVFRKGEHGKVHNPEFSMLEWYRSGDDMQMAISFLGELAKLLLNSDRYETLAYREVFETATGINPHSASAAELVETSIAKKIDRPWSDDHPNRDDWLDLMFAELVQPGLGADTPVIVYDWPATQAALAIVRDEEMPVAERFELFYQGIELANGYHELTDADELAKRNRSANTQRLANGKNSLPEQSRLLQAMRSGLPGCAGVALGVDRLLMILLGTDDISDVIAFPFDRA